LGYLTGNPNQRIIFRTEDYILRISIVIEIKMIIKSILLIIAFCSFAYGFYNQVQARKHISKDKISKLKDMSIVANGPMPSKEILSEEGLKYHIGFKTSAAIFIISLLLLALLDKFSMN